MRNCCHEAFIVWRMFRIETETDRTDKRRREWLHERLRETDSEASAVIRALRGTAAEREAPLQVWALDERGEPAGGLDAHTWAGWLHVNLLWVDTRHRGSGLGSRLLAEAERAGRAARDCTRSRVWTWDFQAPEFYKRHGYDVVCVIPDYPPGITEYTLTKDLVRADAA